MGPPNKSRRYLRLLGVAFYKLNAVIGTENRMHILLLAAVFV